MLRSNDNTLSKNFLRARIFSDLVLIVLFFTCPWWVGGIFVLVVSFIFPWYLEGVVWGFALDILFGTSISVFYGFPYPMTILAMGYYFLSVFLKERLIVRA